MSRTCKTIVTKNSKTTAEPASIIGEGVAIFIVTIDDSTTNTIGTITACAPKLKHRLLSPQWLGI